ncbi:Membrane-bound lytic murein transglycosylase A precursor [Roseivivax sp. THAF40]|uniref:murein transglycosylase A n=1 Tax=unclassified Roseivivax TaxID=2639302 RepID=UPI0012695062|nr:MULTISPECIES: murein transglycosylase A [unclassified Roseivivax]QFS84736.1 Membrane-bound lytic murein transglycosylase A precursor [Roseivivax sp. THAF197b]QFT48563.1 Membrane-bound lytic murein transglycosylase A precursor [Roseivivax sp. THAF40]
MIQRLLAIILGVTLMAPDPSSAADDGPVYEILDFDVLDGWAEDDHGAALTAFLETCRDLKDPDWRALCRAARDDPDPRAFFELFFRPVRITHGAGEGTDKALFTGYFEPELDGALRPGGKYRWPVYKMPPEARAAGQWLTRRDILTSGVMEGRGLEIAWVDDPVELFFLQIQGSGRIRLPDGGVIRVGYGGSNGQEYRSIGVEMIRRNILPEHRVSAEVIKNWVRQNPVQGEELLFHNPSYVFFREVSEVPAHKGPLGAMNRSITPMRSIAVDPAYTPLGAPVWIEKDGRDALRRLMIAQDTGSAIKGAQRADIFAGTGADAGAWAGTLKDPGQMYVLLPIQRAYALLPDPTL